jgi:hypothetical protein
MTPLFTLALLAASIGVALAQSPTYSISGTVYDYMGFPGLPATFVVTGPDGQPVPFDVEGSYIITLSGPPGQYVVTPSLSGSGFSPPNYPVWLDSENPNASGVDFFQYLLTIFGTATDTSGNPLPGVSIDITWVDRHGHQMWAGASTDANGYYGAVIPDWAFPNVFTVTPSRTGFVFQPPSTDVFLWDITSQASADFQGERVSFSVSGRAVDGSTGAALPGATLTLLGRLGDRYTTTTDAGGNFAFTSLQPGAFAAFPSLMGYHWLPSYASVYLHNQDVGGMVFTGYSDAAPAIYRISGKAIDGSTGAGLAGATMTLQGRLGDLHTALTDAAGNFVFTNLKAQAYGLTPSMAGYSWVPRAASVYLYGHDVGGLLLTGYSDAAPAIYRISGKAVDGSTGTALAGATMTLIGRLGDRHTTTTDAGGNFTFTNLKAQAYGLRPSMAGYNWWPAAISVYLYGHDVSGLKFTGHPVP